MSGPMRRKAFGLGELLSSSLMSAEVHACTGRNGRANARLVEVEPPSRREIFSPFGGMRSRGRHAVTWLLHDVLYARNRIRAPGLGLSYRSPRIDGNRSNGTDSGLVARVDRIDVAGLRIPVTGVGNTS
jgi:hypothetical protein